ncbi:hypothetical protein BHE74_00033894 [Ensete ventricosum]|nr:hypothetical protein GW17_00044702 [Ensete ventricosum]RWW59186.1 hypothetical protein BHE74_00033894 [Ensete ventricosum]RZS18163.1 hypothetical protein BHM03_00050439 [Ensete ventricosum]
MKSGTLPASRQWYSVGPTFSSSSPVVRVVRWWTVEMRGRGVRMVGGDPSTMAPCSCGNLENGPFTGNLTLLVLHAARRPAPSSTVSRPPVSLEIPSDFHAGIPRRRPSPAREAVIVPSPLFFLSADLFSNNRFNPKYWAVECWRYDLY